jgi:hypothetical protein
MNAKYDLEHRIADHYAAEAPTRAPDWVLERILTSVDSTHQRRIALGWPWRTPTMSSTLAKLGATVAAVAAVGVVAVALSSSIFVGPAGSASPEPSTDASLPVPRSSAPVSLPPHLTNRFDSRLNGISMNYPAGWQTRPATEPWTDGVIGFDAPGVDVILDPARGEDLYFALASEPLGGRTDDSWTRSLTLPTCPGGHGGGVLTFDGASGWVVTCGGGPVVVHSAVLTNDTHGYAIVLYLGDDGLIDTYTSAWFVSVLETLDLRADEEPRASNPSESR